MELSVDPVVLVRIFYTAATLLMLLAYNNSLLRDRFFTYGCRDDVKKVSKKLHHDSAERNGHGTTPSSDGQRDDALSRQILDKIRALQVPHSWFLHFYALSISCSLFWLYEFLVDGRFLTDIIRAGSISDARRPGMKTDQIFVVWTMLFVQGSRRLYECTIFQKPSGSKIWIAHYALGLSFYIVTNVAIWVEALPILNAQGRAWLLDAQPFFPSIKTVIGTSIFLGATRIQFECHSYLASLNTYAVPTHPNFNNLVCPHYTMECLIYLSMAIAAAPSRRPFNLTLLTALGFVAVNLGITAETSREWYVKKFGSRSVSQKWRMVPFVY